MSFFKIHPIFSAVISVLVAVVGAEIWYLWSLRADEAALESATEQKIGQINMLQRQNPALTDDNLILAKENLEQSNVVFATMLRSLGVTRQDELEYFRDEPASDIDAYFDISTFVDAMRAEAQEAGVSVSPSGQFGFATHKNVGPEPPYIRIVYRQRRILEYLLRRLIAARPQAIVSVQRERPAVAGDSAVAARPPTRGSIGQPGPRASTPAAGAASDFFVVDPQVSARTPGYVDTMAFRLVFVGQTAALREFMNALAAPGLPLVVRSVEVQTSGAEGSGSDTRSNGGSTGNRGDRGDARVNGNPEPEAVSANVPIVAENDGQFTVTVEMFEVMIE